MGNLPFLRMVQQDILADRATQVLLKHPFYAQFYQLYLKFQRQLKLSLDAEQFITALALRRRALYMSCGVFL